MLFRSHYARLVTGSGAPQLHRAVDPGKDQSYVLGVLDREQLAADLLDAGDHVLGVGAVLGEERTQLAAIVGGLVLGTLAIRTRSIWWGAALHISIAVTMDLLALWHVGRVF